MRKRDVIKLIQMAGTAQGKAVAPAVMKSYRGGGPDFPNLCPCLKISVKVLCYRVMLFVLFSAPAAFLKQSSTHRGSIDRYGNYKPVSAPRSQCSYFWYTAV